MRVPKNQDAHSIRQPKIIPELQPNKICKCGACEPNDYAEASAQEQKTQTPEWNAKA